MHFGSGFYAEAPNDDPLSSEKDWNDLGLQLGFVQPDIQDALELQAFFASEASVTASSPLMNGTMAVYDDPSISGLEESILAASIEQGEAAQNVNVRKANSWTNLDVAAHVVPNLVHWTTAFIASLLNWLIAVVTHVVRWTKYPVIAISVISVLWFSVAHLTPHVQYMVANRSPLASAREIKTVDFPRLVELQAGALERISDSLSLGSGLVQEVAEAGMGTKNLSILVEHSQLEYRDAISETLRAWAEQSQDTARFAAKVQSRFLMTIESVIGDDRRALRSLEQYANTLSPEPPGFLSYLGVVRAPSMPPAKAVATFSDSFHSFSKDIKNLIVAIEGLYAHLQTLDALSDHLHDLLLKENGVLTAAHDELVQQLWTALGANKERLAQFERDFELLRFLESWRSQLMKDIQSSLIVLVGLSADMEELRERVVEPAITGRYIALEEQVTSIEEGLARLMQGKALVKRRQQAMLDRAMRRIDMPIGPQVIALNAAQV